jgi:uncharacterized protein
MPSAMAAVPSPAQAGLLASLVIEGVFERFPLLKVVMVESGFAWVPAFAWRLDKTWKALRAAPILSDRRASI